MASMSKEEREAFLSKPHVGVLGVAEEGRGPLTVPIWYSFNPDQEEVVILTGPSSRKATLIEAAGRFSLCVQQEELPYRYVMVEGPVTDTRSAELETDERPMARRYLGDQMGDRYCEEQSPVNSLRIAMRPERWYSVDYGKAAD